MHRSQETIVVCERQPFWEPEMRRQFPQGSVIVRACRTLRDLESMVAGLPADAVRSTVVILSLADAPSASIRWLSRQQAAGDFVPTLVVVDESLRFLEWHVREAGAVSVVSEFIGGHRLAGLVRKQWMSTEPSALTNLQGHEKTRIGRPS